MPMDVPLDIMTTHQRTTHACLKLAGLHIHRFTELQITIWCNPCEPDSIAVIESTYCFD